MKKILIVEDDKKIAMALGVRLRANGYDTVTAHDSCIAATTARHFEPDLILLDISLPGGDGFALAERLKTIRNTASVPIVFITASRKEGLRSRAQEVGAADFFEKPFKASALLESVNRLI
jgi:DNA-binding response OmpR family regulator